MFNSGKIHIGSLIEERLKAHGMTKAEFGRRINTSRQNVNTLLRKEALNTSLLYQISKILKFNFFSYYHDKLPGYVGPDPNRTSGPDQRSLKKSYSLTINSDSQSTLEEVLKKLRQSNWEDEDGEDDGEDSSLFVPA